MNVLIVDDDPVMQLITGHVLTADGNTVHIAANGNEAVDIALHEHIDLVLLDLMLDGENGFDVADRLRAGAAAEVNIIVLSGRSDAGQDARMRSARVAGIIEKPFDATTLCEQIRGILSES